MRFVQVLVVVVLLSITQAWAQTPVGAWAPGDRFDYNFSAQANITGTLNLDVAGREGSLWNLSGRFALAIPTNAGTLYSNSTLHSKYTLDGTLFRSWDNNTRNGPEGSTRSTTVVTYDPPRDDWGLARPAGSSWTQTLRVVRERYAADGRVESISQENITLHSRGAGEESVPAGSSQRTVQRIVQDQEPTDTDGNFTEFFVDRELGVFAKRIDHVAGTSPRVTELHSFALSARADPQTFSPGGTPLPDEGGDAPATASELPSGWILLVALVAGAAIVSILLILGAKRKRVGIGRPPPDPETVIPPAEAKPPGLPTLADVPAPLIPPALPMTESEPVRVAPRAPRDDSPAPQRTSAEELSEIALPPAIEAATPKSTRKKSTPKKTATKNKPKTKRSARRGGVPPRSQK